jgi:hypothetical protein
MSKNPLLRKALGNDIDYKGSLLLVFNGICKMRLYSKTVILAACLPLIHKTGHE